MPSNSQAERLSPAVLRIQVPTKMDFTGTEGQSDRVDADGYFVTSLNTGPWTPNAENCSNPNYAHYSYFQDACQALARGESLEDPIPVREGASGAFVSPNGAVLTGRHVIAECEMYYRGRLPFYCPFLRITITQQDGEQKVIRGAQVLHWSRTQLGEDGDYAILQTGHRPEVWFETCRILARPGESVRALGYPLVSHRDPIRRAGVGYEDADGSLRMSRGQVITPADSVRTSGTDPINSLYEYRYVFTDTDAVPGNSGGPLISSNGCMYGNISRAHRQRPPMDSESMGTRFNASRNNSVFATSNAFVCEELQEKNLYMHLSGCPAPVSPREDGPAAEAFQDVRE